MQSVKRYIDGALKTHHNLTVKNIVRAREIIISFSLPHVARILTFLDKRGYIARISYIYNDEFDNLLKNKNNDDIYAFLEDVYDVDKIINLSILEENEADKVLCLTKSSIILHENELYKLVGKNIPNRNHDGMCNEEKYMSSIIIHMPEYVWINIKDKYYHQSFKIKEEDLIKSLSNNDTKLCTNNDIPLGTCSLLRDKYSINVKLYNEAYQ